MKVAIVNCFETYEERVELVKEYFVGLKHDVEVIESNFSHMEKKYKNTGNKNKVTSIKVPGYQKNLSISRIFSHYIFSKKVTKHIEKNLPDLIYVLIPPNYLVKDISNIKKKYKNIKLIFDLIDLWPETFPLGNVQNVFPFSFWRNIRKTNLKNADLLISECNLYLEVIKNEIVGMNSKVLYLSKDKLNSNIENNLSNEFLDLCYLGSINNLIDIVKIKELIKDLNSYKTVRLHIIGDGEKRNEFIEEIKSVNVQVIFYGKIYDESEKQRIFDMCHFGLNIMKEQVCVGLTMKSIDYFRSGLPIINTIQHDTDKLIEKYECGINLHRVNSEEVIKYSEELNIIMRNNVLEMFENEFSKKVILNKLDLYISKI